MNKQRTNKKTSMFSFYATIEITTETEEEAGLSNVTLTLFAPYGARTND